MDVKNIEIEGKSSGSVEVDGNARVREQQRRRAEKAMDKALDNENDPNVQQANAGRQIEEELRRLQRKERREKEEAQKLAESEELEQLLKVKKTEEELKHELEHRTTRSLLLAEGVPLAAAGPISGTQSTPPKPKVPTLSITDLPLGVPVSHYPDSQIQCAACKLRISLEKSQDSDTHQWESFAEYKSKCSECERMMSKRPIDNKSDTASQHSSGIPMELKGQQRLAPQPVTNSSSGNGCGGCALRFDQGSKLKVPEWVWNFFVTLDATGRLCGDCKNFLKQCPEEYKSLSNKQQLTKNLATTSLTVPTLDAPTRSTAGSIAPAPSSQNPDSMSECLACNAGFGNKRTNDMQPGDWEFLQQYGTCENCKKLLDKCPDQYKAQ